MLFVFVSISFFCLSNASSENLQGYADGTYVDMKFECSSFKKLVYSVPSQMQCHHKCLRNENCALLNYRQPDNVNGNKDNCEVFSLSGEDNSCSSMKDMNGWIAVVFKVSSSVLSLKYYIGLLAIVRLERTQPFFEIHS